MLMRKERCPPSFSFLSYQTHKQIVLLFPPTPFLLPSISLPHNSHSYTKLPVLSPGVGLYSNKILFIKSSGEARQGPGTIVIFSSITLRILLYQVFYNFCATESILQLIWRKQLSISDLLAQVESKNRLRSGTFILQLVKDGDGSREGYIGIVQAQDTIKSSALKLVLPHLDQMAGQYLQGPQSVGEKSVPTYRYMKWSQDWAGVHCCQILREELRLGSVFERTESVRARWKGNLGSI